MNLPKRYTALSFLFPGDLDPVFNDSREAVSREAADRVAELFHTLVKRVRQVGLASGRATLRASNRGRYVRGRYRSASHDDHPGVSNYIWTAEGWLYVAAVVDLFSRRVVAGR